MHFEIGETDVFVDLLFYHMRLHAHIVELKARPFKPADAGQLNFYVYIVNDKLKGQHDADTIGLLLCKGKNEVLAEYALKGYSKVQLVVEGNEYKFSQNAKLKKFLLLTGE